MSSFWIKLLAFAAMLIDHIGYTFEPQLSSVPGLYICFRMFGRLAFPIFALGIAEGASHTSSAKKYLTRMLIFTLISQLPFSLMLGINSPTFSFEAFGKSIGIHASFSVMLTLSLGLAVCLLIKYRLCIYACAAAALSAAIAFTIGMDYGIPGVMLVVSLYLLKDSGYKQALAVIIFSIILYFNPLKHFVYSVYSGSPALSNGVLLCLATMAACIPILLYNGKKGPSTKHLLYVFYPAHMLILWLIWLSI